VIVEALTERKTIQQLGNKYELHPQKITKWKKEYVSKSSRNNESKNALTEGKGRLKIKQAVFIKRQVSFK
jgi:transposase